MAEIFKKYISPVLDRLDSEKGHIAALQLLHLAETTSFTLRILEKFAYEGKRFKDERLKVNLGGIEFENPVMVAAGWTKNGLAVKGLYTLGFSGVEVGTVTERYQDGNPKPRQFMIAPGVAINSLGFNNHGMEKVSKNLIRYKNSGIPIGISIGMNKEVELKDAPEAYVAVLEGLYEYASYIAIGISSPNTPRLRKLQEKGRLNDISQMLNQVMDRKGKRKPTVVKVSPDLSLPELDDLIRVVIDNKFTGVIASNTTTRADLKKKYGTKWEKVSGGLSGDDNDFRNMSNKQIAHIFRETKGEIQIIGSGGVKNSNTAIEKIRAGATLVQVNTAIRSEGTSMPGKTNKEIVVYMAKEGTNSLDEIRGIDANKY